LSLPWPENALHEATVKKHLRAIAAAAGRNRAHGFAARLGRLKVEGRFRWRYSVRLRVSERRARTPELAEQRFVQVRKNIERKAAANDGEQGGGEEGEDRSTLYLNSVHRRWAEEVERASDGVLLFFPFLSREAVEEVLGDTPPEGCRLYTQFRAESFASGASSLDAIRLLLERGVAVYELPRLHAKMLIVPGCFASVGSQNLTIKGRSNQEATVALTDPTEIEDLLRKAEGWTQEAVPVTLERVGKMEERIGELRGMYQELTRKAAAIDREAEPVASRSTVVGRVGPGKTSLLIKGEGLLTEWGEVSLQRSFRHLVLLEEGKLGWARLFGRRISFISQGVAYKDTVVVGGEPVKVTLLAEWDPEGLLRRTLVAEVRSAELPEEAPPIARIDCWFGVDGLELLGVRDASPEVERWVGESKEELHDLLLARLLDPFKFEHNLAGVRAKDFFGSEGTRYDVRLAGVGPHKFLVAQGRSVALERGTFATKLPVPGCGSAEAAHRRPESFLQGTLKRRVDVGPDQGQGGQRGRQGSRQQFLCSRVADGGVGQVELHQPRPQPRPGQGPHPRRPDGVPGQPQRA
jgi:hypothetical protein